MRAKKICRQTIPQPVSGSQVLYLETTYEPGVNKYIKENFDKITSLFRSHGLDFVYEPVTRAELLRYYAPQLNGRALWQDAGWLEYRKMLLRCPDDGKGRVEGPSLVFYGGCNQGFIFFCLPIKKHWFNSYESILLNACQKIVGIKAKNADDKHYTDQDGFTAISSVNCSVEQSLEIIRSRALSKEILQTFRLVSGVWLLAQNTCQNRKREQEKAGEPVKPVAPTPPATPSKNIDRSARVVSKEHDIDYSARESEISKARRKEEERERRLAEYLNSTCDDNYSLSSYADTQFDEESAKIVAEIKERVQALQNKGINTMFLHQLIDVAVPLSRMVITHDYRIILTDYGNMEITMAALPKAIYFLFLRHPEGIRFKELPSYRNELWMIYQKLGTIGDERKQWQSVVRATDPTLNAINESCARIREAFVGKFDDRIARNYYVTGKRGEHKGVLLDRGKIEWK